ncbi:hypothetical protein NIES2100_29310 [Calothrix sp. NIES-2100]|uniref:hypothetical protein n=1 Tax=Calothrix sp. NIES-2100 TaxID=1954172 RepID=UPI000B5DED10|nr:hypothetical protein NIES2100_29310 [Calothrix sp. NIES-2100]
MVKVEGDFRERNYLCWRVSTLRLAQCIASLRDATRTLNSRLWSWLSEVETNGGGIFIPVNRLSLNGQGFVLNGRGFVLNGRGFVLNGQGFVLNGQGFILNGRGFVLNSQGFVLNG